MLEVADHLLPEEMGMEMEIKERQLPAMRLACVRHVGPYYQIGAAFKQLDAWAREQGLSAATRVGLYHDDPCVTPEAELQADAALVLPDGHTFTSDRGTAIIELPGGAYAMGTHVGPYSELPRAWAELHAEFQKSGRVYRSAPPLEIYRSYCAETEPEELVTEIYLPI